jgi:hypothetical protein
LLGNKRDNPGPLSAKPVALGVAVNVRGLARQNRPSHLQLGGFEPGGYWIVDAHHANPE